MWATVIVTMCINIRTTWNSCNNHCVSCVGYSLHDDLTPHNSQVIIVCILSVRLGERVLLAPRGNRPVGFIISDFTDVSHSSVMHSMFLGFEGLSISNKPWAECMCAQASYAACPCCTSGFEIGFVTWRSNKLVCCKETALWPPTNETATCWAIKKKHEPVRP